MNAPICSLHGYWAPSVRRSLKRNWAKFTKWITDRNATSARLIMCLKKRTFAFSLGHFSLMYPAATLSERTNRNSPAINTLVQLLALYTNRESHNEQCYRQADGRTDDRIMSIADAARSAKNRNKKIYSVSANLLVNTIIWFRILTHSCILLYHYVTDT